MSLVEPRLTYNSLTDHHLADYFSRPRHVQHLRQTGLIRRDGGIPSEASLYANSLRKDQKKRAKEAILRSLETRKEDLERNHQALCLRTVDEIEKIERVRRIRSGMKNGCAVSYTDLVDYAVVPSSICHRPISAIFTNGKTCPLLSSSLTLSSRAKSAGISRGGCCPEKDQPERSGHSKVWRDSFGRTTMSPYLQCQLPSGHLPLLPKRKSRKRTGLRRKWRQTDMQKRQTAQALKPRQEGEEEDDGRLVMVTMKYYGDNIRLENDQMDPRVEVLVEQQHCGGNTLYVFRDKILPGTEFSFPSYRHPGYPFSLTIYVNGRHDSRLSVCCEYKHKINARLGGKGGHFAVVDVKGGMPCCRCMMKYCRKNGKNKKNGKNLNKECDETCDRGDNDEETVISRFFPGHRNWLRVPVDDDDNDEDEAYGKEFHKRTAEAQSPKLERKGRPSSAKKLKDPYNHFLYAIKVPVEDDDNDNNVDGTGVSVTTHDSPTHEREMKSSPQVIHEEESSSESESEEDEREESQEEESQEEESQEEESQDADSEYTEDIEKVKPKSSRSQRESNLDDEPASDSGS